MQDGYLAGGAGFHTHPAAAPSCTIAKAMRLRDTLTLLKEANSLLELQPKQEVRDPGGTVIGYKTARAPIAAALNLLGRVPPFAGRVDQLRPMDIWTKGDGETISGSQKHFDDFAARLTTLHDDVGRVASILAGIAVGPEENNVISVRLPPNVNALDKLAEFNEDLRGILDNTVGLYGFRTYEVMGFDSGSMWYELALESSGALVVFYNVLTSAMKLVSRSIGLRKEWEDARRMGLENDALEARTVFEKAILKRETELAAVEIEKVHGGETPTNERLGMLRVGIERLAKLIGEGLRIHVPRLPPTTGSRSETPGLLNAAYDVFEQGDRPQLPASLELPADVPPPAPTSAPPKPPE
jgi:hypothetical protein